MGIRQIHTEADYQAVLKEVSALIDMDPDAGSPDGDRLDVLGTLLEEYEATLLLAPNACHPGGDSRA